MDTSTIYVAKLPLEGTNWEMWTAIGTIALAVVTLFALRIAWKAAMLPIEEARKERNERMMALRQYIYEQFEYARREFVQARDDLAKFQASGSAAVIQAAAKVIPQQHRMVERLLDDVWVYKTACATQIYRAFAQATRGATLTEGIARSSEPGRQEQGFFDTHVTWVLGELGKAIDEAQKCKDEMVEVGAEDTMPPA
jgi:hypothetical protein